MTLVNAVSTMGMRKPGRLPAQLTRPKVVPDLGGGRVTRTAAPHSVTVLAPVWSDGDDIGVVPAVLGPLEPVAYRHGRHTVPGTSHGHGHGHDHGHFRIQHQHCYCHRRHHQH